MGDLDRDVAGAAASAYAEVAARTQEPVAREPAPSATETTHEPAPSAAGKETPGKAVETKSIHEPSEKATDDKGSKDENRDERGRFVPKAAKATDATPQTEGKEPAPTEGAEVKPAEVAGGPPSSWSIKSKAAWDALPAEVRADIVKREGETAQGLAALRDYKDLKPFAERAAKEGTTLSKALTHYLGMEDIVRRDLGAGLAQICQNRGLSQKDAAQLFATLAKKFGGPEVMQGQAGAAPAAAAATAALPEDDPLVVALKPVLGPLEQRIAELTGDRDARAKAEKEARVQSINSTLAAFAAKPENRFYAELEPTIFSLIEKGMVEAKPDFADTLRAAYDLAARMHPEISEALIEQRLAGEREAKRKQEQEAADRAKAASRSVTGSGVPGLKITDVKRPVTGANHRDDIEADARKAWNLHAQAS